MAKPTEAQRREIARVVRRMRRDLHLPPEFDVDVYGYSNPANYDGWGNPVDAKQHRHEECEERAAHAREVKTAVLWHLWLMDRQRDA